VSDGGDLRRRGRARLAHRAGAHWRRSKPHRRSAAPLDEDGFVVQRGCAEGAIQHGAFRRLPESIERYARLPVNGNEPMKPALSLPLIWLPLTVPLKVSFILIGLLILLIQVIAPVLLS
jgi:hypothetical protein